MGDDKVFTFQKQLGIGSAGENLFLQRYKGSTKTDGRKSDLTFQEKLVELKTDTYSMERTSNFFMEHYGSIEGQKIGGPWRAAQDDVHYFVYLYIEQQAFYWFESKPLVKFLDTYIKQLKPKTVRNKGYTTLGYAVPRAGVDHLVVKRDMFK